MLRWEWALPSLLFLFISRDYVKLCLGFISPLRPGCLWVRSDAPGGGCCCPHAILTELSRCASASLSAQQAAMKHEALTPSAAALSDSTGHRSDRAASPPSTPSPHCSWDMPGPGIVSPRPVEGWQRSQHALHLGSQDTFSDSDPELWPAAA